MGRRGALGLLTSLLLVSSFGTAQASHPTMLWIEVFGDVDVRTDPVKGAQLHTWATPFGRGVTAPGLAWVRGRSGVGGSFVDIVVNDSDPATPAVTKTVVAEKATLSDGSPNPTSGQFFTSVNVTDLGTHTATGNPADGDGGASPLTFAVTSRLASGARSEPVYGTLTKYAGTRYDTFAPAFQTTRGNGQSNRVVGSGVWCHNLPEKPFWANATTTPRDVMLQQAKERMGWAEEHPRDTRRWDSLASGCSDTSTYPWRGFSANVTDETAPSPNNWIASELDVVVTLTGGTLTGPKILDNHHISRSGPGASFGLNIHIDEFEPTLYKRMGTGTSATTPGPDEIPAGPYTIKVRISDAWGNFFEWTPMANFDVCRC